MRWLHENVNLMGFLAGFVAVAWGIGQWSAPLAAVVAGAIVMGLTAYPYLRKG
jgi:uncharacterized membrane protein YjjP (DUF1212 family)